MKKDFGIIGLGVMGHNLASNIHRNGFSVAGYDLDSEKRAGSDLEITDSLESLLGALASPKRLLLMVPAGQPVDSVIQALSPRLDPGDVIIDGGNSHFSDTERRLRDLQDAGIYFVGTGISGGEEGALFGPSIMPGGDPRAWPIVREVFQSISAKTPDGSPCCEWVGDGGAGHFVKMIHNGIEYADMQMISEAYLLMDRALNLTTEDMHRVFAEWNEGELSSYLIEITADIMTKIDPETGKPVIDIILDTAGQKGTGKWTSIAALDLGAPAQTIAEAVFARAMSALKEEREMASQVLRGPEREFNGDKNEFVNMIGQALFAAKICSYAQGFQLLKLADREYGWKLNFGSIASIWRAGCIIRAQFLDKIKEAFEKKRDLPNLLLDDYFMSSANQAQKSWRKVVSTALVLGIPVPALSSSLAYYDGYRSHRLPANLLQAQRDYFGAHEYERVDRPRGQFFHTKWT